MYASIGFKVGHKNGPPSPLFKRDEGDKDQVQIPVISHVANWKPPSEEHLLHLNCDGVIIPAALLPCFPPAGKKLHARFEIYVHD